MPNKMKIPETGNFATFNSVEFTFANTSGSIAEVLTNATAKVDLNSVDTVKNAVRDTNLKTKFFANLSTQEANAKITSVDGDDSAGKLTLSVDLNGVSKDVELKYEVKDGKISANGEIDLNEDFNAKEAFEKFSNDPMVQGLHGKKTWPNVNIGFEIATK